MAKLSFTKIKNTKDITPIIIDFQGEKLEIKTYLPIKNKVNMIEEYCNYFLGDKIFNPLKDKAYKRLMIVKYYTNISFTEKQLSNIETLSDKVILSGLYDVVIETLKDTDEIKEVFSLFDECMKAVIAYRNSFVGTVEMLSQQKQLERLVDLEAILKQIDDPETKATIEKLMTVAQN